MMAPLDSYRLRGKEDLNFFGISHHTENDDESSEIKELEEELFHAKRKIDDLEQ